MEFTGSQRVITTTYEARGMVATVTSHDALSGGSVLNEVAYAYDDFGQLSEDAQAHDGEVDGSTPRVLYGHADGSIGNTARRLSMTYPDGRVIDYGFGDAESLDDNLSRVAALKVDGESQDLVTYTYVGAARYVKIAYPEPGIELSYIKNSGEPERDSGDPYTGYDRFGRTVDMKWQSPGGSVMLDRVQYGYDRSSNRTWRRDLAAPAGHDEFFRYDALHQVTDLSRGNLNLNQTAIGGIPVFNENFEYDPTGNWNRYSTAVGGTETLDQTRVNNRDNQITQLDGSNEGILYDRAGRALQMPPDVDGDWSKFHRLVWDAWGRLMQVKDGSLATVAAYAYDGTTRRITKTVGGTTIHSYYNDRWKAVEEREGSSTDASRQYLWGARPNHRDELVRSERDTTGGGTLDERLYCVMDYYDPITMVDASGGVVERYEFSAFGLRSVMDGDWAPLSAFAHAVEFAFHGQFLDAETGYYNYGYRYYSPQIGRWLSKDPIEEGGGVNLYFIVGNDLVNQNDHLGLRAEDEPTLGYTTVISPPEYTSPDGGPPKCGRGQWKIQWKLSEATKSGGYIVQHIKMESSVKDCQGNDVTTERYKRLTYSEAWSVYSNKSGPTYSNIVDDTFRYPGGGNCTEGWFEISGIAEFVPVINLPPQFKAGAGAVDEAGGLLSTEPAMSIAGGTGQIQRKFRMEWNCCKESDSPTKYTFEPVNT